MSDKPTCGICGEPMPAGEEVFKYHGYSGPCPKPLLKKTVREVMVEYIFRDEAESYWLDIKVDREPFHSLGPFASETERLRAKEDLLGMMRSQGAKDCGSA